MTPALRLVGAASGPLRVEGEEPQLHSVVILQLGARVVLSCDGSHGRARIEGTHGAYGHCPCCDPCAGCEHALRPECITVEGCPAAEGWDRARRAYARAKGGV
jgi:hypothetical protein